MTFDSITPSRMTDADVSSQDDSMPNIIVGLIFFYTEK